MFGGHVFGAGTSLAKLVEDHLALLQLQEHIHETEKIWESEASPLSEQLEGWCRNIRGMPVHDTLAYCLVYHPDVSPDHPACPMSVKNRFAMSDDHMLMCGATLQQKLDEWKEVDMDDREKDYVHI
eukprot:NODE_1468_length_1724_cov_72.899438_g1392_i0.p2 GENE.NODE_1468_length_1724_cov_72.899438_g1392_i0~~NODE_1468_length_1724_cov_72.899438_g1392_i0.p2  ORF type:complete len:126 (+),score=29.00 NODE_1468_length_1724_cov_72.899438_g1392_i0:1289-1666(+)